MRSSLLLLGLFLSVSMWGAEATYVFTTQTFSVTLNGESSTAWTATNGSVSQAQASGYNATKGIQTTLTTFVLTCPDTYSNVSKVDIYYSTNNSSTAKLKVAVGTQESDQQQVSKSKTNEKMSFAFTNAGEDKSIVITQNRNGTSGSLYIKTIVITYSGSSESTD